MRKTDVQLLTDELRNRHISQHLSASRRAGAEDGEEGLPKLVGDSLRRCLGPILAPYMGMRNEVLQRTGVGAHVPEGRAIGEHARARIASRTEQATSLREGQRKLGIDYRRVATPTYPWGVFPWLAGSLAILAVGQWAFDAYAFEVLGALLPAILFAAAIATATIWSSHAAPSIIALGRTRRQRILIALALLFTHLGIFWAVAVIRTNYFTADAAAGGTSHGHYNPPAWLFAAINLFIWGAGVVIYMYWPSRQQWLERSDERAKARHFQRGERKISALQRANEIDDDSRHNKQVGLVREVVEVRDLLNLVKAWSREAAFEYMRENVLKRSDGAVPDCFHDEIPNLDDVISATTPQVP